MITKQIHVFDISTENGLREAEQFQRKLYALYGTVIVKPYGFNKVVVCGSDKHESNK